MSFSARRHFKVVIALAVLATSLGFATRAHADWGDMFCDIMDEAHGADGLASAVDLYNQDNEEDRACTTFIRFFGGMTVSMPGGLQITQAPSQGYTKGTSIRRCFNANDGLVYNGQPYVEEGCPDLTNTAVVLDFSGYAADGGDCPVQIKSGARASIQRIKIIAKNPNKAICSFDTKQPIPAEDMNNAYAWVHDVDIRGASDERPDRDGDGVPDASDNCPDISNADQANADGDAQGDACDSDDCSGVTVSDSNACTTDACDPATGAITHTPIATDDGNACTTDGCSPATGATHTPIVTDDSNACTTDACDPVTGVSHTPIATDDGDACTTDACDPVAGVTHTPVATDDSDACTTDACDPTTGVSHTPIATDDSSVCTTDACDPVAGVTHTPVATDDSDACTTDACDPVAGVTHTAVATDDSNVCTTDACDPVAGVTHTAVATDDSNACTTDACDPVTGVTHTPIAGCSGGSGTDTDGDGIKDDVDLCPTAAGPVLNGGCPPDKCIGQVDHLAHDKLGVDADGDGIDKACDSNDSVPSGNDDDGDGISNSTDLCPSESGLIANGGCPASKCISQVDGLPKTKTGTDADGDGIDVACDSDDNVPSTDDDADDDGVVNTSDNCPFVSNPGQADADSDGIGDACDAGSSTSPGVDSDGDGIPDTIETDVFKTDPNTADSDGDGLSDGQEVGSPLYPICGPRDPDCDDDGICDGPGTFKDAAGNVICQPATEGKGDNCPLVSNGPNTKDLAAEDIQKDTDGDGIGDVCQGDMDGDGVADDVDNCAIVPNEDQEDGDSNGIGDDCDPGFSVSPSGGGGCGCQMGGSVDDPVGLLPYALLMFPILIVRVLSRRGRGVSLG